MVEIHIPEVKSWEVEIRINGESVLTIGGKAAAHVAGIENIVDYADTVRDAAQHLISFIGMPIPNCEMCGQPRDACGHPGCDPFPF